MVEAKADWEKDWAWARYDPAKTSPEKLVEAINEDTAFEARLPEKSENEVSLPPAGTTTGARAHAS